MKLFDPNRHGFISKDYIKKEEIFHFLVKHEDYQFSNIEYCPYERIILKNEEMTLQDVDSEMYPFTGYKLLF